MRGLEGMPSLEYLHLSRVLPSISLRAAEEGHRDISLPRLRRLEVTDATLTCSFLMRHIHFPATTPVWLTCVGHERQDLRLLALAITSRLRSHSPVETTSPILSLHVQGPHLLAWTAPIAVERFLQLAGKASGNALLHKLLSPALPTALLAVTINQSQSQRDANDLSWRHTFVTLCPYLPLESVHTFVLANGMLPLEREEPLAVAKKMPNVREVMLRGIEAEELAIMAAALAAEASCEGGTAAVPEYQLFPRLKQLILHSCSMRKPPNSPVPFDSTRVCADMLAARKAAQREVERVVLRQCVHTQEEDIASLRRSATVVDWDGLNAALAPGDSGYVKNCELCRSYGKRCDSMDARLLPSNDQW